MKHPIPRAALDDRLGFIGTSGSGKTYNAGTAIEMLLAGRARTVIIDPLGVWWGLRLLADGKKPSNFNVVIFGGDHADLPLNEQAGALIGETAATMAESCIIDLSKLPSRSAERRFMIAFLETLFRKAGGEPFHLVVDEADLFAPQKPQAGDEVLLGHMDNIVRRGRVRGFIPWLISQRPAVLNKNVLSQVDGLLAFKLTASQDRDALDAWIEGQADKAQGKAIKDALPTFQVGEGLVWLPGLGILDRQPFPKKVTFDSSRKPKRGEKLKSRKLKPLDVGKLKEQLATVVQEAKANDPKELRAEVAKLKSELAKKPKVETVTVGDPKAVADAEARGHARGKIEGYAEGVTDVATVADQILKAIVPIKTIVANLDKLVPQVQSVIDRASAKHVKAAVKVAAKAAKEAAKQPGSPTGNGHFPAPAPPRAPLAPARAPSPAPAGGDGSSGDGTLTPMKQAILNAVAWIDSIGQKEATKTLVAFLANSSPKSSTFDKYMSQLKSAGLIVSPRKDRFSITDEGRAQADAGAGAADHATLMANIGKKLTPGQMNILNAVVAVYPNQIEKNDIAAGANQSATSSTFDKYLSQVKSLGLVEQPIKGGAYVASGNLFP